MTRRRALAYGGIVGPLVFVATWAIAGATRRGYSPTEDAISRLAQMHAPTEAAMTTAFVVYGAGVAAFGIALRARSRGAGTAALATGIATAGVAAVPLGSSGFDRAHAAVVAVAYLALLLTPALDARVLASAGHVTWARWSWVAAVTGAAGLLLSVVGWRTGLWQRVGLTAVDGWIVIRALDLVGHPEPG